MRNRHIGVPVIALLTAGLSGSSAAAQESNRATRLPAFEVASVKVAIDPGPVPMFCIIPCFPGERLTVVGSRVDIRFMSLYQLIVRAYRIKPVHQLSGPDWMRSQRFDIAAKLPEGVSADGIPEMLQALLADRFKLSIHRESREQPVYALVVGKNGSKLRPAETADTASDRVRPEDQALYSGQGDARRLASGDVVITNGPLGPIRSGRGAHGIRIEFSSLTMAGLVDLVAPHEERPVVDMTNLKGAYYFVWEDNVSGDNGSGGRKGSRGGPPEGGRAGGPDAESGPPRDPLGEALFAAIEKAGLKLESRKAPVEMIVVDRLEKVPTEN